MYREVLKKSGYKLTKPRKLVLDYLAKKHQPISAQQIYQSLKNNLDQTTVYRILEVLEELGIVFKEIGNKQALYYLADKQHHHIICRNCGCIQCVPCNHAFKQIKNFKNIRHQLVLTGLCNKCSK